MKVLLGVQGEFGCCAPKRKILRPALGTDARPNPAFRQQLGAASMMGRGPILPRAERQAYHGPWHRWNDQGGAIPFPSPCLPAARVLLLPELPSGTARLGSPFPIPGGSELSPQLLQLITAMKTKVNGSTGAPLRLSLQRAGEQDQTLGLGVALWGRA